MRMVSVPHIPICNHCEQIWCINAKNPRLKHQCNSVLKDTGLDFIPIYTCEC